MSLSALAIALVSLACRDLAGPSDTLLRPAGAVRSLGSIVVSPGNMRGWSFINDQAGGVCTDPVCRLVAGPAPAPAGIGSAELSTTLSADGAALVLQAFRGTRLDSITDLRYSTYRQTNDAGNNLAIALQFDADFDLTDQAAGYQGRLVFEPHQGNGGNVPQSTWQTWDAKAGKWWGTKASVPVNGALAANPCVQATPCTWAQLLAAFPNAGIHATNGAVVLKAGSGWPSFRGNVDNLVIGVNGTATTFDFELESRPSFPVVPPDSMPSDLSDSTKWVSGGPHYAGTILRDILVLVFRSGTSQSDRQSAIDLVNGVVVGGRPLTRDDGVYLIRVPTDGTLEPLFQAIAALRTLPQVSIAIPDEIIFSGPPWRRPMDGIGGRSRRPLAAPASARAVGRPTAAR